MKTEPASNLRFSGTSASPGHAQGPIAMVANQTVIARQVGNPGQEAQALRQAMRQACRSLKSLIAQSAQETADILDIQVAMLEDDSLSEGAFAAIETGVSAHQAWAFALDNEIAGYQQAESEYFRARAADLIDLKERVLDALNGTFNRRIAPGSILVADDLSPSRFIAHDWTGGGLVLRHGSSTSHVAMLARSRGIPMLVGADISESAVQDGANALLNGTIGILVVDPDDATVAEFSARGQEARRAAAIAAGFERAPGESADGIAISVQINIAGVAELDQLDPQICDGIGLVRTELLFEGTALPDEEQQFQAYRRIAEWAKGRPVTIRTLDAGGDKPIAGLTPVGESNPFLGLRGVRLTLQRPEIFKTQLRALARAAAYGRVRIMAPMVSVPAELVATRGLLEIAIDELSRQGLPHQRPALGMMVEVPSAAIAIGEFDADFFSIGSNDLTQYVMAAGRDIGAVAYLADAGNTAVLALIRQVVEHGRSHDRDVSLCGDAAGDRAVLPKLLRTGLRSLSVAPGLVGATKAHLAKLAIGAG
jgi:phosphoenolpyruvate-protein phosphotransferase (PTS system enzyme I)